MAQAQRVVTDSMIGLAMPDIVRYSRRVAMVLGQNPSPFTGPGTNTYLIGQGPAPLLLDTGQGVPRYRDLLRQGLAEMFENTPIERVVVTHAHVDHISGVAQVVELCGPVAVMKKPWPGHDGAVGSALIPLDDGSVIEAEGVTLRAVHTPGHAPDHLCFYLEEERALFTGDVVLGAGTTVIPDGTGNLGQYLRSLRRLLELDIAVIYPGHGPAIRNPHEKIRQYIEHRELRERQILDALSAGPLSVKEIVKKIYVDVPEHLHPAAASSVRSHLRKLSEEGLVEETGDEGRWRIN